MTCGTARRLAPLLALATALATVLLLCLVAVSAHAEGAHGAVHHARAGFRSRDGRLFYVVTADSRLPLLVRLGYTNLTAHNIAADGEAFRGGTLWKIWKMWLWLPRAEHSGVDVVIFTDGDMLFGGCTPDDIVTHYDATVSATGASIVASAEAQCYAPGPRVERLARCRQYERAPFPQRAQHGLQLIPTRDRNHPLTRRRCFAQQEGAAPGAYCGQYAYLNSGGYAGPPRALMPMIRSMLLAAGTSLTTGLWRWLAGGMSFYLLPNDQTLMAAYMHEHPSQVGTSNAHPQTGPYQALGPTSPGSWSAPVSPSLLHITLGPPNLAGHTRLQRHPLPLHLWSGPALDALPDPERRNAHQQRPPRMLDSR